jgi:pectin methylesterase-like acyl-CoA thioesterase
VAARLQVGGEHYSSIQDAINAAAPGAVITVPGGVYTERLVIYGNMTIAAEAGARVEITWQTPQPYQSTIQVRHLSVLIYAVCQ